MNTDTLKGLLMHLGLALGLLSILSFTFFYKVLPSLTNKGEIVTVPDLRGMSIEKANKFIKGKNLEIQVIDSSYNAELPPLTVLEQFPEPNSKVKVNRKVNLKLNAKIPPVVRYPDLAGSTFDLAQKQLRNLDLKIGTIQYRIDIAHNSILESKVNGRTIRAGDIISKGAKVDLIIGHLKNKFSLPDLTDMPLDEAEAYILAMSLKIKEIHYVDGGQGELNTVQRQSPQPGDTVRLGDTIELWIVKREE